MDQKDLNRVFLFTGATALLMGIIATLIHATWGQRFLIMSAIALTNWVALSMIIRGFTEKNPFLMCWGILLKPPVIVALLIYGVTIRYEISSFLIAFNWFFLVVMIYSISRQFSSVPTEPSHFLPAGVEK